MKVYKVELFIEDFDELGEEEIRDVLENTKYLNHCLSPEVLKIEGKDIGEWEDEHPLNILSTRVAEINKIFGKEN